MSETALVKACLVWLRLHGVMAWRQNTGAMTVQARGQRSRFIRFGMVGASDIFGVFRGRFLAVECKRPSNTPTWAQEQFLQEARDHGAWAVWVTSVEDLERFWNKELADAPTH
mgnify:CR=1 FL=1